MDPLREDRLRRRRERERLQRAAETEEHREDRLRRRRELETEEHREDRLRRRRERERSQRAAETEEQKAERLRIRRERDQARRANARLCLGAAEQAQTLNQTLRLQGEQREARLRAMRTSRTLRLQEETADQREARLEVMRTSQTLRLQEETADQSEARLQAMRTSRTLRLQEETADQSEARLQAMRTSRTQQIQEETAEQREARLQSMRRYRASTQQESTSHSSTPQAPATPLFQQESVRNKMLKFHSDIATICSPVCSTCLAGFPGMNLHHNSTECQRCSRDKHMPKLYSCANNMNPGSIPPELQVSLHFAVC